MFLRLRGHFWCLSKWNVPSTRVAIKYLVLVRNLPESGYSSTRFNPRWDPSPSPLNPSRQSIFQCSNPQTMKINLGGWILKSQCDTVWSHFPLSYPLLLLGAICEGLLVQRITEAQWMLHNFMRRFNTRLFDNKEYTLTNCAMTFLTTFDTCRFFLI